MRLNVWFMIQVLTDLDFYCTCLLRFRVCVVLFRVTCMDYFFTDVCLSNVSTLVSEYIIDLYIFKKNLRIGNVFAYACMTCTLLHVLILHFDLTMQHIFTNASIYMIWLSFSAYVCMYKNICRFIACTCSPFNRCSIVMSAITLLHGSVLYKQWNLQIIHILLLKDIALYSPRHPFPCMGIHIWIRRWGSDAV